MLIREPGELDMETVTSLHNWLLKESSMYKYALENNLIGLCAQLQLTHVSEYMQLKKEGKLV